MINCSKKRELAWADDWEGGAYNFTDKVTDKLDAKKQERFYTSFMTVAVILIKYAKYWKNMYWKSDCPICRVYEQSAKEC